MIYYILLAVSLCLGVAKNIISKCGEKSFGFLSGLMSVNILTSLIALIIFSSGISGIKSVFGVLFLIMALLYGLLTLGSQSFYITAVKDGSVSVCSLIYASCFIIPTVYSIIRNGETASLTKIFGIALMLFSVVLVSLKNKGEAGGASFKSVKYAVLAMCSAGSVGILQKEFNNIYSSEYLNTFLFAAFVFMLLTSLIIKTVTSRGDNGRAVKYDKSFFIPAVLLSLSVVIANKLNLILVANIAGIIFFPIINGGTIMFSAICSGIVFKEKISPRTGIGIIIGIIAIVFIAI